MKRVDWKDRVTFLLHAELNSLIAFIKNVLSLNKKGEWYMNKPKCPLWLQWSECIHPEWPIHWHDKLPIETHRLHHTYRFLRFAGSMFNCFFNIRCTVPNRNLALKIFGFPVFLTYQELLNPEAFSISTWCSQLEQRDGYTIWWACSPCCHIFYLFVLFQPLIANLAPHINGAQTILMLGRSFTSVGLWILANLNLSLVSYSFVIFGKLYPNLLSFICKTQFCSL